MSNPYQAPVAPISQPIDTDRSVGEGTIFKCWLLFFLMASILGFFAGMAIGIVVGVVIAATGGNTGSIRVWSTLLGFVVGIPVSYICFRFCVKRFVIDPLMVAARLRRVDVLQ